jgi:hypothetical protein
MNILSFPLWRTFVSWGSYAKQKDGRNNIFYFIRFKALMYDIKTIKFKMSYNIQYDIIKLKALMYDIKTIKFKMSYNI